MRPEFVIMKMVTENGSVDVPINPNLVIRLLAITIPGLLKGPDGASMSKAGTGLDVGFSIIPVDHNPAEARAMLEGKGNDALTKTMLEG